MGTCHGVVPYVSQPAFGAEAAAMARVLATVEVEEMRQMLHVNTKIAAENVLRYSRFYEEEEPAVPALLAYTGIVFRQVGVEQFTAEDWDYAQHHLFITSFLYGLLRPLDAIRPYRLEGNVRLGEEGLTRFEYWRPLLTDKLIAAVKADDGVLVNLASAEMKRLFDWKRVCREVRVVTPEFKVMQEGHWRTVVVYSKMCRGQMTRFLLRHQLKTVEELSLYEPDIEGVALAMEMKSGTTSKVCG